MIGLAGASQCISGSAGSNQTARSAWHGGGQAILAVPAGARALAEGSAPHQRSSPAAPAKGKSLQPGFLR